MDAVLWQRVQEVFADTIDLEPGAQASYLTSACAGRPELLAEVQSLLDAHRRAGGFIEPVPDHVGHYRLLEQIAHGGMGAVYRASRDDGQFEQQVAVKLLSLAATPSLYRRFLDEQQILATLSHPNIARLLDGGLSRSGIPYIVMEFIDGVPIDRYCDGLAVPERLRLFRTVCGAVHYAHQNLVVHRDLKPANILVTNDGVPKLLDFGVAKMLAADRRRSDATVVPAMTPEYASPEQVRGAAISTVSDVYSLGVILFELLTGRRPYELSGKTYEEIRETVSDRAAERPATGSQDLDAIIAKAMRKDPADRYASAEALSADVDRFLVKRPVTARRGAIWYVFTKFLMRHRVAVAAATVVALLLASAAWITVRQSRLAERRFQDVRELGSSVLFDIHDTVARLPGSTAARKLIISQAVMHLDKLARGTGGDPELQLELGRGYLRLGDVQGLQSTANLGDQEGAMASYRKAKALLGAIDRGPYRDRATSALAEVCRHHASVLVWARRSEEAKELAAEALALLEALVARSPTSANRRALAAAYHGYGDVSGDQSYGLKAIDLAEALLASAPGDEALQRDVAIMHKYVAAPLLRISAGDRGLPHLRRAEELDAARAAANPNDREAQLDLSFDYSQNGTYFLNREQFDAALVNFQKAAETRKRLSESDPTDVRLRDRLVYVYLRVGFTLLRLHNAKDALATYEQAAIVSEGLLTVEPPQPQYRSNLAVARFGAGKALSALGRRPAACASWQTAVRLYAALDREGKLLNEERADVAELKTLAGSCPEAERETSVR